MGAEVPQWLFSSFTEAMHDIGATAPVPVLEAEARDLISRWNERGRALHNTRHLIKVLARIDGIASTAHDPDVLRIALWYQGAFLNRGMDLLLCNTDTIDQTHVAFDHASARLTALGVNEDVIARIRELMFDLARHRAALGDVDGQVLVDADLGLLAESPQEFKRYREALREECSDLPDVDFARGRRALVRRLLARDRIFCSPLAESWEEPARANLEVELAKLNRIIAAWEPDAVSDDDGDDASDELTDAPDSDVTATGTIIIRRRPLKKKVADLPETTGEIPVTTGAFPTISPAAAAAPMAMPLTAGTSSSDEEDGASSLESAIDALDLPSTRAH